eukprot:SAG22_NODE_1349_length_4655_cov_6.900132_2_plen_70_part_00
MARLLQAGGSNVTMNEVRKDAGGEPAGHWWWDTKSTNDGGVSCRHCLSAVLPLPFYLRQCLFVRFRSTR